VNLSRRGDRRSKGVKPLDQIVFGDGDIRFPEKLSLTVGHGKNEIWLRAYDLAKSLGDTQEHLFTAEGTQLAREAKKAAAAHEEAAVSQRLLIESARVALAEAISLERLARRVIGPYKRARSYARYMLFLYALWFGDVAAITGAAILMGERVDLAAMLAVAVGTAAQCSGTLGGDLRRFSDARRRAKDELTEEEATIASFFQPPRCDLLRWLVFGGLLLVALVTTGVASLRSAIDGPIAGAIYGTFAAAVALGSWFNGWAYADEASDLLAYHASSVREARERLVAISAGGPVAELAAAQAEADSIAAEHEARGAAARAHLVSEADAYLLRHPEIAGHGYRRQGSGDNGHGAVHEVVPYTKASGLGETL
jgi:prophage antirepressor-like protein